MVETTSHPWRLCSSVSHLGHLRNLLALPTLAIAWAFFRVALTPFSYTLSSIFSGVALAMFEVIISVKTTATHRMATSDSCTAGIDHRTLVTFKLPQSLTVSIELIQTLDAYQASVPLTHHIDNLAIELALI